MEGRRSRGWLLLVLLALAWTGFGLFARTVLDPWSREAVQERCEVHGSAIDRTGATYVPLHRDEPATPVPTRTRHRFNFNGGWCAYEGTGPNSVVPASDLGLGTQGLTMLHGYGLAATLVVVPVGAFVLCVVVVSSRWGQRRVARAGRP